MSKAWKYDFIWFWILLCTQGDWDFQSDAKEDALSLLSQTRLTVGLGQALAWLTRIMFRDAVSIHIRFELWIPLFWQDTILWLILLGCVLCTSCIQTFQKLSNKLSNSDFSSKQVSKQALDLPACTIDRDSRHSAILGVILVLLLREQITTFWRVYHLYTYKRCRKNAMSCFLSHFFAT